MQAIETDSFVSVNEMDSWKKENHKTFFFATTSVSTGRISSNDYYRINTDIQKWDCVFVFVQYRSYYVFLL